MQVKKPGEAVEGGEQEAEEEGEDAGEDEGEGGDESEGKDREEDVAVAEAAAGALAILGGIVPGEEEGGSKFDGVCGDRCKSCVGMFLL
jgi:hypothetical protein